MSAEPFHLECPLCGDDVELAGEDLSRLEAGDRLVCGSCGAELEVLDPDPDHFEAQLLGLLLSCPYCGAEVAVDEDAAEAGRVRCPNCGEELELDQEDPDEDQEDQGEAGGDTGPQRDLM
jgi:lysine biosynthesis protein LysW